MRLRSLRQVVVQWMRREDLAMLLTALAIVIGTWLVLEISDMLAEGMEHDLDRWIVMALRRTPGSAEPIGPRWLQVAARDITALGSRAVLTLATAAVAICLSLIRRHRESLLLVGASLAGLFVMQALKALVARPRPFPMPGIIDDPTSSFPSGHAMLSAVVYLTLGSILSSLVPSRRLRSYTFGVALAVTFLVGISRVYLGVHYPSDVFAGWTLGLSWGMACSILTHRLAESGQMQP
ncbi:MAG: phosphatase PAP2 family protein [Planctomycetia bacterium]|nr:phosphatase PAP2 family protein [Planctomycetia bacterium]